jgi:hypothetical protein
MVDINIIIFKLNNLIMMLKATKKGSLGSNLGIIKL